MSDLDSTTSLRSKILPPPALLKDELASCFGKREMEMAAKVIIAKCVEAGTWLTELDRTMFVGIDPSDYTLDGWDDLIEHEWLAPAYGDRWRVVDEFVDRLMKKRPDAFKTDA
jgi:hypothetical protein